MSTATPPASVVVLDSAITWVGGCLVAALTAPSDLPTPCRGWDLGQLLAHLEDSVVALTEAAETGQVDVSTTGPGAGPGQAVERLLRRTHLARAAWRQRPTSAPIGFDDLLLGRDTVALVGALEIAVHGWDVACAVGRAPESARYGVSGSGAVCPAGAGWTDDADAGDR